jgi:anthraniloyl-CoA monooxygenase
MFTPFTVRGVTLKNRVVVSPMAMYSSVDGVPGDFHLVHLGSRALGGAGMVVAEMTCVSPDARITPACPGLWNDAQRDAWKRIVDFVHANSDTKIAMQLGHAGRKGSTQLGWEKMDYPLADGNWPLISASALPYMPDVSQVPREMTRKTWTACVMTSWPTRSARRKLASTGLSCTAPTAICFRVSSRR